MRQDQPSSPVIVIHILPHGALLRACRWRHLVAHCLARQARYDARTVHCPGAGTMVFLPPRYRHGAPSHREPMMLVSYKPINPIVLAGLVVIVMPSSKLVESVQPCQARRSL